MVLVPLAAAAVWATVRYWTLMLGECTSTLLTRYRWLLGRFWPDAYWYGLLWCLQSTALSLIPAVLASEPLVEVLAIAFVTRAGGVRVLSLLAATMLILRLQKLRSAKEFAAILRHHKGEGAVLARFVKLAMQRSTTAKICIDWDKLKDLGR